MSGTGMLTHVLLGKVLNTPENLFSQNASHRSLMKAEA